MGDNIEWGTAKIRYCDVCGARAKLVKNREVYGKNMDEWDYVWLCSDLRCCAYAGTKKGTIVAESRMRIPTLMEARMYAHWAIDALWKTKNQRTNTYQWLAKQMKMTAAECHIANFTVEQCAKVVRLVYELEPVIESKVPDMRRFERRKVT